MSAFWRKQFIKQVRNTLLAGIFIVIPIAGSMFIFWKLFLMVDRALPAIMGTRWFPGIGFFVTFGILFLVGLLAKHWFGRKIIATGNSIITSIPFLNNIYRVLKQIIDTVTLDKKAMFDRTVLVEYPRKESWVVGFVTSENNASFSTRAGRKLVAVFIPTVPNPTSGFLLYLPEEDLINLDMPVETGFKLIISAGIIGTEKQISVPGTSTDTPFNWTDIFKPRDRKPKPFNQDPRD